MGTPEPRPRDESLLLAEALAEVRAAEQALGRVLAGRGAPPPLPQLDEAERAPRARARPQ